MPKEGLVQDMSMKGSTQEVLVPEESGTILTQDVPARVETVAAGLTLGLNRVHADGAEPYLGNVMGGDASAPVPLGERALTWWSVALVLASLGAQPQAMRYQPSGFLVLWI
jgi:hypothetical protein